MGRPSGVRGRSPAHVRVGTAALSRLASGHAQRSLTARGHDRVLRLARTIADLAGADRVEREHVTAALGFRHEAADVVGAAA